VGVLAAQLSVDTVADRILAFLCYSVLRT
jgi:hypothetical protein